MVSYAYDSWGKVTAIEGDQDLGKKNPLRYRGYYWDEETGLYYLASRYYDPEVGRFINADNINLVLIDFKTDYISNEANAKEKILEKYKVQLEIYKTALEQALGRKVNKTALCLVKDEYYLEIL